MKKVVDMVGLFCLATAFSLMGIGCAQTLRPDDKRPEQSKDAEQKYANRLAPPKYVLISDGGRLYLDYDGKEFDIIKGSSYFV